MKRTAQPSSTCKAKTRRQGWHAETYCEPDPDDKPEEDAHHHTHATFSSSGGRTSTSTLFSQGSQPYQPLPSTTFTESTDARENDGYYLSGDSLDWMRYGIMDPAESAAWDEEHGLKDKRARTASVIFTCIKPSFIFSLECILGQSHGAVGIAQPFVDSG
jgi:hypothetical protein